VTGAENMTDKRLFRIVSVNEADTFGANFVAVHISREHDMSGERVYLSLADYRDCVLRILADVRAAHRAIGSDVVAKVLSDVIVEIEEL
jgi:hypothetical protein